MAENYWIDPTRPSAARIYDYMLGGAHNFEADRLAARAMLERFPEARLAGRANRDFLRRVVACCRERGISQFLDLGSGIPTAGNVHDIARRHHPDARVAYVDIEAVAVAHSRDVLAGVPDVSITRADLRRPEQVLAACGVADLLDFTRPIAVLAVAALHYVSPSDDLPAVIAAYRAALAPGSAFAMSHGSDDVHDPVAAAHMRDLADVMAGSANPAYIRSRAELAEALAGFDLLEPGLVDIRRWRTHSDLPDAAVYGALGVLRSNG